MNGHEMLLQKFIEESNKIEGIERAPTVDELSITKEFWAKININVNDVVALVKVYEPKAVLRNKLGLDVRVGDYLPPKGSPQIFSDLSALVSSVNDDKLSPYLLHQSYEAIHPFTDGNGRSGRALWAWHMLNWNYSPGVALGFLHTWYYQSLAQDRDTQ